MNRHWQSLGNLVRDRRALIVAALFAIGPFFFIHNYAPGAGIVGNAARGQIFLTDPCPPPSPQANSGAVTFDDLIDPQSCVVKLPYRFALLAALGLVAAHFMLRRRNLAAPKD